MNLVWLEGNRENTEEVLKKVYLEELGLSPDSISVPNGAKQIGAVGWMVDGILAGVGELAEKNNQYYIASLAVLAPYRKERIGQALALNLMGKARALGAYEISVDSHEKLVDFYKELGFVPCGESYKANGGCFIPMSAALNSEEAFNHILNWIQPTDDALVSKAWARLDSLVKPPRSLGALEEIAAKLYGIRHGNTQRFKKSAVLVMSADNGIVEEGIASAPQETTVFMTYNFIKGLTGVSVLAKEMGADLWVVDVGIMAEMDSPHIHHKKVMMGTHNFTKEPAMSKTQALEALFVGFNSVKEAMDAGYEVLGVGEMGIGNTTTASAVLSAISGRPAQDTVGKGAGLDDAGYNKKKNIIDEALKRYHLGPDSNPLDILHHVGGLDIAAMAGAYIGGAFYGVPMVADGFISSVAALLAVRLCPAVQSYIFMSHASYEKGYRLITELIGMTPAYNLNMRLGEGSGCPLMFKVLDAAQAVIRDMGTFADGNISEEYAEKVSDQSNFEVQ